MKTNTCAGVLSLIGLFAVETSAVEIQWTDWQTSNPLSGGGTEVKGKIVTSTTTIDVNYSNPNGIAFTQLDGGTDFWASGPSGAYGRNPATSPYTSSFVDNIPTGTDIIALRYMGTQTLTFSETIANPVFSYVSLNGNGYAFDQDFEILSVGNTDGNDQGYWGTGSSYKSIVDLGGGNFEYQLLGSGEPHGTIRFLGAFDQVTWRSLSSENWNGFTVGVQGTATEVFPDAGSTAVLVGVGLFGLAFARRSSRQA